MKKQVKILNEFLRSVVQLMDPTSSPDEKMKFMMDPVARRRVFDQFPHCTLPIKFINAENVQPYFFVCNRNGLRDPDMINFSLKLCDRLQQLKHIDQDHLCMIRKKLMLLKSRYDKPIPTPFENSYRKARSTMKLNNIIRSLQSIRNPQMNNDEE